MSVVLSVKRHFVMVGTYFSVPCEYNESLTGKVFYIFLSWDPDNAVAYIYNDKLVENSETTLYQKVKQEGFNVVRLDKGNKLRLDIQYVRLKYQNLSVICLVKDDDGRGAVIWKRSAVLIVIAPPQILRFKQSIVNVTRGESKSVKLICRADGHPPPVVRWWKRGSRHLVQPQAFDNRTLTARYYLPTPFESKQDGTYLCEAVTNHIYMKKIGVSRVIRAIRLNVQFSPEVVSKQSIIYTDIGRRVSFFIDVMGNPQPQLDCSFFTIREPKYFRVQGRPSRHHFQYEIILPHVENSQIGEHPCWAINSLGRDNATIHLQLGPSVPKILSSVVSDFANYYALRFSVQSMAQIQNVSVEIANRNKKGDLINIRKVESPVFRMSLQSANDVNKTFTYPVTNLSSNTRYGIRVKTCNRHGCGPFCRFKEFRTAYYNGTNSMDPLIILRLRQQIQLTTLKTSKTRRRTRGCTTDGFNSYSCSGSSIDLLMPVHLYFLILSFFYFYWTLY